MTQRGSTGAARRGGGRQAGRRGIAEMIGFGVVLALFVLCAESPRSGFAQSTNVTTTISSTYSVHITPVGAAAGYSYLLNPAVQGVLQRLNTLGLPSTLTFTGNTIEISTQTTFGPATILIGEDQSITFFVPAGTMNINTHTHISAFFNLLLAANNPAVGLLSGDFHTSFQTALLDQNWSFLDALFAQLRGFGVNGAGPGANAQFASLGADDARGVNIAQLGPDGRPLPSPWFVWVRPHGTLGKVDSSAERLGFRYDIAGVSAGLEYRWPGPWIAGGTLGYAHTSLTQTTTNDKGRINSLQIGAYGGYRDQRLHVVVAGLFQQNWISSERFTVLAPAVATASYSAQAYSVGVEAGRKYPVMTAWLQPLASLVFTHLRQGGFTESGTTLLEIAGSARSVNALKLSLGARVWRDFDLGWGTITPEFRARWVQDLLNERRAITARFVGDASQTAFAVNGAKPTPAAAVIGGSLTYSAGPGFKLTFAYDAELRANSRSHTLQAQLKLRW